MSFTSRSDSDEYLTQRLEHPKFQAMRFRSVHIIDVENLAGEDIGFGTIRQALSLYETATGPRDADVLIVGIAEMHHGILVGLAKQRPNDRGFTFGYTTVLGRNGANGADEALLTALELLRRRTAPLRDDFGQACFGSGDWQFVEPARQLEHEGLWIVQVQGKGKVSRQWKVRVHADRRSFHNKMAAYYARRAKQRKPRQGEQGNSNG